MSNVVLTAWSCQGSEAGQLHTDQFLSILLWWSGGSQAPQQLPCTPLPQTCSLQKEIENAYKGTCKTSYSLFVKATKPEMVLQKLQSKRVKSTKATRIVSRNYTILPIKANPETFVLLPNLGFCFMKLYQIRATF